MAVLKAELRHGGRLAAEEEKGGMPIEGELSSFHSMDTSGTIGLTTMACKHAHRPTLVVEISLTTH